MLKLYNSLTKKKENFKPLKKGQVSMYNCGPTVYDYVHIGNLRSFLFADLARRYLEFSGFKVRQIMNITDVGHMLQDEEDNLDKIEGAAEKQGKTPKQVASFYTKAFFQDIKKLGIEPAYKYPKATAHVKEMIKMVEKLMKKGYAYEINNSVYFNLKKFPAYGRLSGNNLKNLMAGARVEIHTDKRNPFDFALWIHNPKHKMQWNSPWGKGYPGWHIECSAMAEKYLGATIDIHTGGEDNKFPHHEAEIAQSETANGRKFVKYWLHVKHLLVNGEKMSKSKGNFYTLEDLLKKGYSPCAVRYLLATTHYRDELNFTLDGVVAAESALERIDEAYAKLSKPGRGKFNFKKEVIAARKKFVSAMEDDFNVASAVAAIFEFIKKLNMVAELGMREADRKESLELLEDFGDVFGIKFEKTKPDKIPAEIKSLAKERDNARAAKDWAKADEIRNKITATGYLVEDTPAGAKIKKQN